VSVPQSLKHALAPDENRTLPAPARALPGAPIVRAMRDVPSAKMGMGMGVGVRMSPLILLTGVLGLAACKTSNPKDDEVIFINPSPESSADVAAAPRSAPTEIRPALLSEAVRPVRGGPKVLPPYRGEDPCKMALVGDSPVAKSCSDGGIRKATEMMQMFVKRARAEGIVFVCTDCHPDEDDFSKLAPGVDVEFRKLLFLARPAD
jgi:hypothetical protein